MQRVGDRARAVVAFGLERAVPAAPHVRARRDFIRGGDHARDDAFGFAAAGARTAAVVAGATARRARRGERGGGRGERGRVLHADHRPRGGADDAVDREAVAGLQTAHRGLGFRAEFAVDGELQRPLQPLDGGRARGGGRCLAAILSAAAAGGESDVARRGARRGVPRCGGLRQRRGGGGQRLLAAHADHVPRGGPDDAVDGEPVAGLQAAHGGLGRGAEVAVGADAQRALQLLDGAHFGFFGALFLSLLFRFNALGFGFRFSRFEPRLGLRAAGGVAREVRDAFAARRGAGALRGRGCGGGRGQRRRPGEQAADVRDERLAGALGAQRGARQRPHDAVDGQAAAFLEAADRGFRFRAEDAVHLDAAERLLQQLHLAAFAAIAEHDHVFGGGRRFRAGRRAGRRLAAGEARGGADRQRHERSERDALGARARRHEAQLGGAPACARAPERELPWLLVGEVARLGERAAVLQQRGQRGARVGAAANAPALGASTACARALKRCAPVVDNSKITRGSRHPRRPFSIPLHGAYGVS